jgi:hypothetical protein
MVRLPTEMAIGILGDTFKALPSGRAFCLWQAEIPSRVTMQEIRHGTHQT